MADRNRRPYSPNRGAPGGRGGGPGGGGGARGGAVVPAGGPGGGGGRPNLNTTSSAREVFTSEAIVRERQEMARTGGAESRSEEGDIGTPPPFNLSIDLDVTLAHPDCHLNLSGETLSIDWTPPNAAPQNFDVDLNQHIGVIAGQVVWGGAADFSLMCDTFDLVGTVVRATAHLSDGTAVENTFDLNYHIEYTADGVFAPVPPDLEFSQFLSAASWMNFTVIAQANMDAFLSNPAFRRAVGQAATRAVKQSMDQMRAHMEEMRSRTEKMIQALNSIEVMTEQRIQHQVERLVRTAALGSSFFGGSQLAIMAESQKRAFNDFAPHLNMVPPIVEPVLHFEQVQEARR